MRSAFHAVYVLYTLNRVEIALYCIHTAYVSAYCVSYVCVPHTHTLAHNSCNKNSQQRFISFACIYRNDQNISPSRCFFLCCAHSPACKQQQHNEPFLCIGAMFNGKFFMSVLHTPPSLCTLCHPILFSLAHTHTHTYATVYACCVYAINIQFSVHLIPFACALTLAISRLECFFFSFNSSQMRNEKNVGRAIIIFSIVFDLFFRILCVFRREISQNYGNN